MDVTDDSQWGSLTKVLGFALWIQGEANVGYVILQAHRLDWGKMQVPKKVLGKKNFPHWQLQVTMAHQVLMGLHVKMPPKTTQLWAQVAPEHKGILLWGRDTQDAVKERAVLGATEMPWMVGEHGPEAAQY